MGFLCRHQKQTNPRRDGEGEYRRCLDCGTRLTWAWADDFPIPPPRMAEPRRSFSLVRGRTTPAIWLEKRESA